jgi:hypothetical protein
VKKIKMMKIAIFVVLVAFAALVSARPEPEEKKVEVAKVTKAAEVLLSTTAKPAAKLVNDGAIVFADDDAKDDAAKDGEGKEGEGGKLENRFGFLGALLGGGKDVLEIFFIRS